MEVRSCHRCKKLFQYISGPSICPRCRQLEEEYFQKVKDYLREYPGANMNEINEHTGVAVSLIEKFLREGRLEVSADSPISLTCQSCGKKILTGTLCNECKMKMSKELGEIRDGLIGRNQPKDDSGPKMRYLKSDRVK